jgi:hypothetical protein
MTDDTSKQMSAAEREARANIPASALRDMTAIDYNPMADRAAFNIATSGPTSAIPKDYGQPAPVAPVNTSGNVRPLGPMPGIDLVDRICIAADQRERAQAAQATDFTQMMAVMTKQMEMHSQMLTALVALVARMDDKAKPKPEGKK